MSQYVENGAFEAWLILPEEQSVEVLLTATSDVLSSRILSKGQTQINGSDLLLEGFTLDLTPLWEGL